MTDKSPMIQMTAQQNIEHTTAMLVRNGRATAAIPLGAVREMLPACAVSPGRSFPDHVIGVFNLHGDVLPVIDLARLFRERPAVLHPRQRFAICSTARGDVAILVDEVVEFVSTTASRVLDVRTTIADAHRYVVVEGQVVPVLEPSEMLNGLDDFFTSALREAELLQLEEETL
ncbi:MAG: chemotaxis protein CheW [Bacteroidia bacterium]|nr:chemotaxis protein CheW [Bacteroidia bacterium]